MLLGLIGNFVLAGKDRRGEIKSGENGTEQIMADVWSGI